MKKEKVLEKCPGTACPLRDYCQRYSPHINRKAEPYFAFTPYSYEKKKCVFQIPIQDGSITITDDRKN